MVIFGTGGMGGEAEISAHNVFWSGSSGRLKTADPNRNEVAKPRASDSNGDEKFSREANPALVDVRCAKIRLVFLT